jgi:hypothetical protein
MSCLFKHTKKLIDLQSLEVSLKINRLTYDATQRNLVNMSEATIYLDFSKDIRRLIDENEISIPNILQRENIEVDDITEEVIPGEEGTTREMVLAILVAGAKVASVICAISKVLEILSDNKPHEIEYEELGAKKDANGNPQGGNKKGKTTSKKFSLEGEFRGKLRIKFSYEYEEKE